MTPDEYEAAFHGIDLPDKLELATGVVVTDVRAFVDSSIVILRTGNSPRVADMVRYRLDLALTLINL
jgi:hypothetical protein